MIINGSQFSILKTANLHLLLVIWKSLDGDQRRMTGACLPTLGGLPTLDALGLAGVLPGDHAGTPGCDGDTGDTGAVVTHHVLDHPSHGYPESLVPVIANTLAPLKWI